MSWVRGFVICRDNVADAVGRQLKVQSESIQLVSQAVETAFAFASRTIPRLEADSCAVCSVDGRNSGYSYSSFEAYRPSCLVPKLGLTFGISFVGRFADLLSESPDLNVLWQTLGPESEIGTCGKSTSFRWDLDDWEIDDPRIRSHSESLRAIHQWLKVQRISHRVILFDDGWPDVLGDLPEVGEVFTGPATCLTLRWQSSEGDPSSVVANDAEFMTDGDDIPDSELWAM